MDILVGILMVVVGLTVAVSGLRMFFFMLPIAGFVTGFFAGATLIDNWWGGSFLSTATGWIVGLALGIGFAIISYLWWYAGAILAAGASGALLLSGLFAAFGVSSGAMLVTFAIIGAVLFMVIAMMLNLPIYVVLVNTAIIGAYMVIGGLILIFSRQDLDDFGYGAAVSAVNDSWWWWLVLVAVAGFGIASQLAMINSVRMPEDKWIKAEAA